MHTVLWAQLVGAPVLKRTSGTNSLSVQRGIGLAAASILDSTEAATFANLR